MSASTDVWLERLGRERLRYHRGRRRIVVESELLDGVTHSICVYRSSIVRWEPPHELEPVTEADRDQILNDIRRIVLAAGSRDIQVA